MYQNTKMLFDLSNYDQDEWHYKQISLEKSVNFNKLTFEVIRENGWNVYYGAIVIDDILIENQRCNSKYSFEVFFCENLLTNLEREKNT